MVTFYGVSSRKTSLCADVISLALGRPPWNVVWLYPSITTDKLHVAAYEM